MHYQLQLEARRIVLSIRLSADQTSFVSFQDWKRWFVPVKRENMALNSSVAFRLVKQLNSMEQLQSLWQ